MLYTCETIDAAELFSLGGCTEVVPADQLETRAREVASQIAGKSGKALRLGKQALLLPSNATPHRPFAEYYDPETIEIVARAYARDVDLLRYSC